MVRYLFPFLLLLVACEDPDVKGDGPVDGDEAEDTDDGSGDTDTGGGDTGENGETGDTDTGTPPVDNDGDGHDAVNDCDDSDATVYPGAEELCDGKDNDCDGRFDIDEDADADAIADCEDYCPVYASPNATGDGRMVDPVGTIQDAVDLAGETGCNEVRAYQGTYYENVDWHGWPVNAESVSGAGVTVIDGMGAGSVLTFQTAEDESARVYDFTLTNGGGGKGGGVRILGAAPTIEANVITDNAVTVTGGDYGTGGGIWIYNASPTILDNEISANDACYAGPENGCDGGAIAIRGGEPTIVGNWMTDNSAGDGGAVWTAYSDAYIAQNVVSGNWADDQGEADAAGEYWERGQGGGINVQIPGTDGPVVTNNIITDNVASQYGGGIVTYEDHSSYGEATITNNVIAFNDVTDTDYGAGFCQWRNTTPTVYNNIVYDNHGVGVYSEDDIDGTFSYNLVNGNETAYGGMQGSSTGNISGDPKFGGVSDDGDWTNDDFTLQSASPAINAGKTDVYDADGSRSDMGAFGGPSGAW